MPPEFSAIYDNEEDIPQTIDDFRSLFVEKDGRWELSGIGGIQTDANVRRLELSAEKERAAHKATKTKLGAKLEAWGDLDPTEVLPKLDRIPELEAAAAGKLDEAALEELATKRAEAIVKSKTAPLSRELKKLEAERNELLEANQGLTAKDRKRAREDVLRPLIREAKVLPEHEEDVFLYAERHFEQAEDGSGFFVRDGITGITPGATPKDWLEEMLEKRPGWLPPNVSGRARGSGGGGGFTGKNPWTAEHWNLTEQGRIIKDPKRGRAYADRLASMAGTTVGGPKPDAKPAK